MAAGQLRNKVDIEKKSTTPDGAGGQEASWSRLKSVQARIKPSTTRRNWFSENLQYTVTHEILLRYDKEIRPSMRIIYKDRVFEIHGIANRYERDRYMLLMCEERDHGGC